MKAPGYQRWVVPGGHIPLESFGREPENTSRDELQLLNIGDQDANVEITIYYDDRDPVGPYPLKVKSRRVRFVRFNDLIKPEAIYLNRDYAAVIDADVPIFVQFYRLDSSQPAKAILGIMAFPISD